jgi:aryl-alcohol dehydrogenase-like predicted oxidoreductase
MTSTLRIGDLETRRIGFGAARITGPGCWGPPADRAACVHLLRRAVELGVDFFDTADVYGTGASEEIIREALHPYRGLTIATKGGIVRSADAPDVWRLDGRPEQLARAVEGSLRRLGVERIDLYQLHRVDPRVPLEDQVGALRELQRAGRIRHVGLSEVSVAELERAARIVDVASVHNLYHLLDRGGDDVLAWCEARGVAFIPWYPLASGALTRAGGALDALAAKTGATPAQLALAWLLNRSPVTLPIPGTSSLAHLEENVGATRVTLSDEDRAALAAVTTI